tara:strand:+ start:718 stop:978 length:261 start_codon:yes stop_codon:yes gene_type:complete
MDLIIKDEPYEIKVGKEVYKVNYPSFAETQKIAKQFRTIEDDGEKSLKAMIQWLKDLGLDEKFFGLSVVKAKHIMTVWSEINSIKK